MRSRSAVFYYDARPSTTTLSELLIDLENVRQHTTLVGICASGPAAGKRFAGVVPSSVSSPTSYARAMSSSTRPHRGTGNGSSSASGSSSHSHSPRDSYAAARAPKASTSSSGGGGALSAPHPIEMTSFIQTSFIPAVAPTPDELAAKDAAFVYLETFVHRVAPGATLKPFGCASLALYRLPYPLTLTPGRW